MNASAGLANLLASIDRQRQKEAENPVRSKCPLGPIMDAVYSARIEISAGRFLAEFCSEAGSGPAEIDVAALRAGLLETEVALRTASDAISRARALFKREFDQSSRGGGA